MATILITGGTGLIGRALTKELTEQGENIIILTRNKKNNAGNRQIRYATWNVAEGKIELQAIQQADYIVHLAGANVGEGRWTEKRKKEIVESRTQSAGLLVKALNEIPNKVKAVVSASAIGWYGPDPVVPNPRPFTETDPADNAFLGATCRQWEESIEPVAALGKRLVKLRLGIVLSEEGGAYAEFKKPLQLGAATILGSGKQVVSWIHVADAARLFLFALKNEKLSGTYNAVAPRPATNRHLIMAMAKAKGGVAIPMKVPGFALKAMLGEMSIEVLKSATVSSRKMEEAGYQFLFPTIEAACLNLHKKAS